MRLVETSPALRQKQKATLASSAATITWHDSFAELPEGPLLLVANEFFDALPVRQFVGDRARLVRAACGTCRRRA